MTAGNWNRARRVAVCLGLCSVTLLRASDVFAFICDLEIERPPTLDELQTLEHNIEERKSELVIREQRVKLTQGKFEVEASKMEPSPDVLRVAAKERRDALLEEEQARKSLARMEDEFECARDAYEKAKRWKHGILPGVSLSGSADGKSMFGASLSYVHRTHAFFEWAGSLSGHWTNHGVEGSQPRLLMAGGRMSHGVRHAWIHLGLAGGFSRGKELSRALVVSPEIALGFRGRYEHTGAASLLLDFNLFMRPVFSSIRGEHTSVFFGIEFQPGLGLGAGER